MTISAQLLRAKRRGRPSRLDDPKYVETLRRLYPFHQTTELSEMLNVPLRTVQDHVSQLGLAAQQNGSLPKQEAESQPFGAGQTTENVGIVPVSPTMGASPKEAEVETSHS